MGLWSFLKSLVNSEAMGDEVLAVQERAYRAAQDMYPGADPHVLLAQVWLSRMAAHGRNPMDETLQMVSFTETWQFACVAPPHNVRALALYILYKESPDIIQRYPKFGQEYARLMGPVLTALQSGEGLEDLYQRFNPQMAARSK